MCQVLATGEAWWNATSVARCRKQCACATNLASSSERAIHLIAAPRLLPLHRFEVEDFAKQIRGKSLRDKNSVGRVGVRDLFFRVGPGGNILLYLQFIAVSISKLIILAEKLINLRRLLTSVHTPA